MGTPVDFFKTIGSGLLGQSETKVIFRSNFTPDITIDVSKLSTGGDPEDIVTSPSTGVMALIRPQVALTAAGLRKNVAPYGVPIKNAWIIAVASLLISGMLGSKIAWYLCKKVPGR